MFEKKNIGQVIQIEVEIYQAHFYKCRILVENPNKFMGLDNFKYLVMLTVQCSFFSKRTIIKKHSPDLSDLTPNKRETIGKCET